MRFRTYLRWEGWAGVVVGAGMFAFGLLSGHQGPADAVMSGLIMLTGTGVFLKLRRGVRFRDPAAWFTSVPIAEASPARAPCGRRSLLLRLLAEIVVFCALAVGLSFLTGFWLTYMDAGVWALLTGAIKLGPGVDAVARQEHEQGAVYVVARRPPRGLVDLTEVPATRAR